MDAELAILPQDQVDLQALWKVDDIELSAVAVGILSAIVIWRRNAPIIRE
jgi:hypothetical protein